MHDVTITLCAPNINIFTRIMCLQVSKPFVGQNWQMHYNELIRNYFLILQFVGIFAAKKQISLTKAGSIAEEVITAIKTVKAFGGQNKESER